MDEKLDITTAPDQGWTHDPATKSNWNSHMGPDRINRAKFDNGWIGLSTESLTSRCGAIHPSDPNAEVGSCGGSPGHEHPHVWIRHGWIVKSVSRKGRHVYP